MTPEELQEIIDEVLQAVRTNSKTIAQLTEAASAVDGDYIELSGGRKVSIATLKTIFSGGGGGGDAYTKAESDAKFATKTQLNTDNIEDFTGQGETLTETLELLNSAINEKLGTSSIVQTTGTATDKVMSQKAVSDLIGDVESLLSAI